MLVVSQVSALALTNVGHGTRTVNYGKVYAGDANNIAFTSYTLSNDNARGLARVRVPYIGSFDAYASKNNRVARASYTFRAFDTTGNHTHCYDESLVY